MSRPPATSDPASSLNRRPIRCPEDYGIPLPDWLRCCIEHVPPGQGETCPTDTEALLAAAFDFAFQLHDGQVRASGEPYIIHPVAVADLLRDIGASASVIAAGFLHDVVEDTDVTPEQIEEHFGAEVRALVEGVTKLGGIHFTNKTEAQAENLRRMFLAMASDIRVVLVKLADRLHNMRTLGALKPEKQQRIARETREIYGPLANRLGIGRLKWELEDLAFKILEPEAYREIKQQVATKRSEREERLAVTVELLRQRLVVSGLGACEVSGRPKHLYGIWSKMQAQQKAFHEIYDVAALRILTPDLESCYRALAVVHDTFRPIPGRFKDYIGLPKPNGYQSLHTAVIGRHRPIEVQIRTAEMHQVAEYGIAAHWKYKEGGSPAALGNDAERFNWLRQLVDWQKDGGSEDSSDYLASIKEDLFDEEVFVFTPTGDVVGLRKGSTAVDFAYRIHSEVGNHCQEFASTIASVPCRRRCRTATSCRSSRRRTPTRALIGSTSWPPPRPAIASASGTRRATARRTSCAAQRCWSGNWAAMASMPCCAARPWPRWRAAATWWAPRTCWLRSASAASRCSRR